MAAKELDRIRPEFVKRVNKSLISQLLDEILKDKIVNDGERESILEENATTGDKARALIDMVKKKGERASKALIAYIEIKDPSLHSELGLPCDQPAPPAAEPQKEEEWSPTLIPVTEDFWSKKQNDKKNYPASKKSLKSRVALLITNIKFTNANMNRKGAEKDEANMEKLLASLGYEVVKHTDLTAKAIDDAVIKFSKHPKLEHTDSVVVVVMSHGKLGTICGVDYKNTSGNEPPAEFPIDNIYKHLGSESCKALLDKPKIIIIQACRGAEEGAVFVRDSPDVLSDDASPPCPSPSADKDNIDDDRCVHREKDFTSLLASTPDTLSYRHRDDGSLMIQFVVKVFNTLAHKKNIDKLFKEVLKCFEDLALQHRRQMPTIDRYTLTKDFYFYPGL